MTADFFVLRNDQVRARAAARCHSAETGTAVRFQPSTRSLEQNAKMWAMLQDLADQVPWPVDGVEQKLTKEEWKAITTAGLRKTQRVAHGIEGGFVLLGESTSKMTVGEMRELVDFIDYFGSTRQPPVRWSGPEVDDGKA